MKQLSENYLVD